MGLVSLAVSATLIELAPGPIVSFVVCRTLSGQVAAALAFLAGTIAGDMIAFALAISGLALVATTEWSGVLLGLKVAGLSYLLVIAWQMIRPDAASTAALGSVDNSLAVAALAGLLTTLSSPFTYLLFLTVLPAAMEVDRLATASILPVAGVLLAAKIGVFGGYIILATCIAGLLSNAGQQQRLNRTLGWMLLGTTVWIAAT